MDNNFFKKLCKQVLYSGGFQKVKNEYYLESAELLCRVSLQRSNYGQYYYINYGYWIKKVLTTQDYSSLCISHVCGRFRVGTPPRAQINYEEWTEESLIQALEDYLNTAVLLPMYHGKRVIAEKLGEFYFLTLDQEKVRKLLEE